MVGQSEHKGRDHIYGGRGYRGRGRGCGCRFTYGEKHTWSGEHVDKISVEIKVDFLTCDSGPAGWCRLRFSAGFL